MSVFWTGVAEFGLALERTTAKASVEARLAVSESASELEKQAKQNASGRPGPNVVTGSLRRGIQTDPIRPWGVLGWETKVKPTVIYSRRIELGFIGTDSLGRHYNQQPYPYFLPAYRKVAPRMLEIYAKHWRVALTTL